MPTVTLSRPAQGQETIVIASDQNAMFALEFSTSDVTLSRDGDSLVFTFEDGAVIRIDDFYTSYHADNIPEFEVAGKIVSGAEFFSTLGPDLSPAAGPTAVERSSHYAEHGDSALASGLDHLDSLDYRTENEAFSDGPLLMDGPDMARAPSAAGGGPGGGPDGGNNGQDTHSPYHTRLIVSDTSANTFNFFAVDEDGNIVNDASKITNLEFEGDNTYFVITGIAPDGRITVELTAAGLAALNDGTLASDMLLISVDGVEYKMPLLVNGGPAGQSYDAADEEARAQIGNDLKAEWYATDSKTVINDTITLGGTSYNQVDIDLSNTGLFDDVTGVVNSNIDISASSKGEVNITAVTPDVLTKSAYGVATHESDNASSSIRGGDASSINISAQNSMPGYVYGVYTKAAQNSTAATTIEGGNVSITAQGGTGYGVYAGANSSNVINATQNVDINIQASSANAWGIFASAADNQPATNIITGHDITVNSSSDIHDAYGMLAKEGGTNSITGSGDVTVTANSALFGSGMNASNSSSNTVAASGDVNISANSVTNASSGMFADTGSSNTINAENGDVNVSGHSATGGGKGMSAESGGSNTINADNGNVTISGSGAQLSYGMFASFSGGNTINAGGDVTIIGNSNTDSAGMSAISSGSNTINAGGNVTVTANGNGSGVYAGGYAQSAINTDSGNVDVTVDGKNAAGATLGVASSDHANNTIKTGSGDVSVTATGNTSNTASAMYAITYADTIISTKTGDVTLTSSHHGMFAETSGHNTITTDSGKVGITAGSGFDNGFGMYATKSGRNDIITAGSDVTVTANGSNSSQGMATESGSNSITTSATGNVTVTAGGSGTVYGMRSSGAGGNAIKTQDGNVHVAGGELGVSAIGYGMLADNRSQNVITTNGGDVSITGSGDSAYGMTAANGGINTIKAIGGEVDVTANGSSNSYGMAATDGGINLIQPGSGPVTVTITATADSAEKAIAMWADGGNAVNYITGSSKAGGPGDSITLNANNGQGIAMQAENGGQNIITTGAGNDSVTINGAIKGSGNEINLSRGDNTLTLNGAVEPGSLNVKTEGIGASAGTYTLILQAPDAESFVSHYGDWLNDIGSDDLIANGMRGITFDGLDTSTLPPDFLAEFNDILWDLHAEGVSIQPPELVDQLHAPAGSFSAPLSAMADDTGVEHHTQDAQHAAGHDDVQDSLLPAHDGQDSVTDDGQHAAFNAHSDPAGHASALGADTLAAGTPGADALEHDATVSAHFSAEADEQMQPLFASLSGHAADMPADASADMPLEGGDDTLRSGHPGNEAADSGALAGLHASITLAYANENFDSLFVDTTVQAAEQDETGPEVTALHDVPLTSMNAVLVQSHLAGSAAHDSPAAVAESTITVTGEISSVSSVMDSCQENTDNAAREMASC